MKRKLKKTEVPLTAAPWLSSCLHLHLQLLRLQSVAQTVVNLLLETPSFVLVQSPPSEGGRPSRRRRAVVGTWVCWPCAEWERELGCGGLVPASWSSCGFSRADDGLIAWA